MWNTSKSTPDQAASDPAGERELSKWLRSIQVRTSEWLIVPVGLSLTVSVPGLVVWTRSMVRSLHRIRRSPDDRLARWVYGWEGTFALLNGLATCMSLALILVLTTGSSGLALAGVVTVNLLVQPVAILFCRAGVRKVTLGLSGQVAYAWRRVAESELAGLSPSERRGLAWFCAFQGVVALAFGAAISVGCAGLLVQSVLAFQEPSESAIGRPAGRCSPPSAAPKGEEIKRALPRASAAAVGSSQWRCESRRSCGGIAGYDPGVVDELVGERCIGIQSIHHSSAS